MIEDQTRIDGVDCITFKNRSNNEKNYMKIKNELFCRSEIGMFSGKTPQSLYLGNGCIKKENIAHLLLHALMLNHEHERPDRDKYIEILENNIKPGKQKYRKQFWGLV